MSMQDVKRKATMQSLQAGATAILGGLALWKIHWIAGAVLLGGAVFLGIRWLRYRAKWGMRF